MINKYIVDNGKIKELLHSLHNFPDNRQNIYTQILIICQPLLKSLCSKYKKLPIYTDLQQEASLSLIKSLDTFDCHKKLGFYNWCYRWIKKDLAIHVFKHKREALYITHVPDARSLQAHNSSHERPDQFLEMCDTYKAIYCKFQNLTSGSKLLGEALRQPHLMSTKQMAHSLNFSYEHVRRLKNILNPKSLIR